MKYTVKDVISVLDIERGNVKREDIIGKQAYFSGSIRKILDYANEDYSPHLGTIESAKDYGFYIKPYHRSWVYIILKKEPKKILKPFDLSNPEHRKIIREKGWIKKKGIENAGKEMLIVSIGAELGPEKCVYFDDGYATPEHLLK